MAAQNMNMIGSEMPQGAYQQVTYTTTNYGSPMATTNVQQQPQQQQAMMQSVFQAQAQQQQQQQILAERVGDIPRNGSSDMIVKLSEQGMSFDQSANNTPISRNVGQPASVGAEQYQMVTTTTSVSGTVAVANVGEQAPIDNNGTPR